ncbi:MAG: hypothetical protein AABY93_17685 [Bacteroidota bacterium]
MKALVFILFLLPLVSAGQISFFNLPNPDMLPDVGYSYSEYDLYQSLKGQKTVNASVFRMSVQAAPFLETGANIWFNSDHPQDPNRIVLATKWRVWLYQNKKVKLSMSPGNWTSLYFVKDTPMKNILYNFLGISIQHSKYIYTRFMFGGYGKFIKNQTSQYGLITGLEQRLSKSLVFVTDYFSGSGEGYGLAPGFVFYAKENGTNLPIYLAYQFDNDSRQNDLLLFEIGYFLRYWKPKNRH